MIKVKYEKIVSIECPEDFNSLCYRIKEYYSMDDDKELVLKFKCTLKDGSLREKEIKNEESFKAFKNKFFKESNNIEVQIGIQQIYNNNDLNCENQENVESEQMLEKIENQNKIIEELNKEIKKLKWEIKKVYELETQVQFLTKQIYKLREKEIIRNVEKIKKKTNKIIFNGQKKNYLSCKFLNNKELTIKKRQIKKNKPIEYEIKVYNDSIETLTWTEKTFLRCENDDSDFFFFKSYDKKIQIEEKESQIVTYLYKIKILFKNYKNIQLGKQMLRFRLMSDNIGIIGKEVGTLIINIIE